MSRTSFQFSKKTDESPPLLYNTLIEVVNNTTFDTIAELAAKMLISESDISYFNYELIGGVNRTEAKIEVDYSPLQQIFKNTTCNTFDDIEGKLTTISRWETWYNSPLRDVNLPGCTNIASGSTFNYIGHNQPYCDIKIPVCTSLHNSVFNNLRIASSTTITCPVFLATSNSGNPHPAIQSAINQGATIIYV